MEADRPPVRFNFSGSDTLGFEGPVPDTVVPAFTVVDQYGKAVVAKRSGVLLPMASRVGEVITERFELPNARTMIAMLNIKVHNGGSFILGMDLEDPATGEWFEYTSWTGLGNDPGMSMAVADPTATQADYGTTKVVVKRVALPYVTRLRVKPNNLTVPCEYSLSIFLGA